jgi:hypothetical protein
MLVYPIVFGFTRIFFFSSLSENTEETAGTVRLVGGHAQLKELDIGDHSPVPSSHPSTPTIEWNREKISKYHTPPNKYIASHQIHVSEGIAPPPLRSCASGGRVPVPLLFRRRGEPPCVCDLGVRPGRPFGAARDCRLPLPLPSKSTKLTSLVNFSTK